MKRIVGKLLFLILYSIALHADVVLEVTTSDDVPLKQAAVGQPFIIRVSETDSHGSIKQPEISGLKAFSQHGNTFTMHTVNNTSTLVYKYTVRADELGTYTVGPAVIKDGTEIRSSNSVNLIVGNEVVADKRYHHKQPQVFMRLETDKNNVVVGEKIQCTLTTYFSDRLRTRVQTIQKPLELEEYFTFVQQDQMERGEEYIEGNSYLYGRWKWELYPKKTGTIVIPAWSVDYSMLDPEPSFFSFMGFWENKRVYSNALDLDIHPLPFHASPVTAIGLFDSYAATLEPHVIEQGSGIVLRLTLTGQGNWRFITHPTLQNIPEAFRSYESTSSLEMAKKGEKKIFEYIIHGVQEGEWEIPSQSLTYFDTENRVYKTLTTVPLSVAITPSTCPLEVLPQLPNTISQPSDEIFHLKELPVSGQVNWMFSWFFFLALWLFPFVPVCFWGFQLIFRWYCKRYGVLITKYFAFSRAKTKLQQAKDVQDPYALYPLFVQLFASRAQVPVSYVSKEFIRSMLNNYLDKTTLEQWSFFLKKIEHMRFVHRQQSVTLLFDVARNWIELFEKKGIKYVIPAGYDSGIVSRVPQHN